MNEILEILEKDARLTAEEIAKMIKKPVAAVKKQIKDLEKKGIIIKYKTVLNRQVLKRDDAVEALIEVKVLPQKNVGFDKIAERIYLFPEVKSCYLVSGTYDLLLVVEGKSIHTVANFVAEKLAPLSEVQGTTTHFRLKTYKDDGVVLTKRPKDKRLAVTF